MAATIPYKDILRVRLFGRFLGIYDEYAYDVLKCYIETMDYLKSL
jgi:hypothetical protein